MRVAAGPEACRARRRASRVRQVLLDPDPDAADHRRARGLGPRRRGGVGLAWARRSGAPVARRRARARRRVDARPVPRRRCSHAAARADGHHRARWPDAPGRVVGPGPRGARRARPGPGACRSRSAGTVPRPRCSGRSPTPPPGPRLQLRRRSTRPGPRAAPVGETLLTPRARLPDPASRSTAEAEVATPKRVIGSGRGGGWRCRSGRELGTSLWNGAAGRPSRSTTQPVAGAPRARSARPSRGRTGCRRARRARRARAAPRRSPRRRPAAAGRSPARGAPGPAARTRSSGTRTSSAASWSRRPPSRRGGGAPRTRGQVALELRALERVERTGRVGSQRACSARDR